MSRNKPSLTTGDILQRFKKVHGDKYDYSRFAYVGGHHPSTIGCREHGWFKQRPNNHAKGAGCPKCGKRSMANTQSFNQEKVITSFKKAHGDLYDYSKVVYKKNTTKVTIGCPTHGWFEQTPKGHKRGIGCAKCGPARCAKSRKVTLEEFIRRSRKHHGDRFDYSLVDLENNGIKDIVKIICPVHGITQQQAYHHMKGFGCKKCDAQRIGDQSKISHDQFIQNCKVKHGNTYDYSKTVYIDSKRKVVITCKEHGDFKQQASSHSGGRGCPQCSQSHGERAISRWLDEHSIPHTIEKRFKDCRSPKGRMMKFDFYLPSCNILIEYDGHHHYQEIERFSSQGRNLKLIQEYDAMKNAYAKKKGIPLLRIPFFSFDDIPDLLAQFLPQAVTAVRE